MSGAFPFFGHAQAAQTSRIAFTPSTFLRLGPGRFAVMSRRYDIPVYWISYGHGYDAKLHPDRKAFARAKLIKGSVYEYTLVWFYGPTLWRPQRYRNITKLERQVERWVKSHRASSERKMPPDPMHSSPAGENLSTSAVRLSTRIG